MIPGIGTNQLCVLGPTDGAETVLEDVVSAGHFPLADHGVPESSELSILSYLLKF